MYQTIRKNSHQKLQDKTLKLADQTCTSMMEATSSRRDSDSITKEDITSQEESRERDGSPRTSGLKYDIRRAPEKKKFKLC